jgi:SAM-dependent methyltransferase
MSEELFPDLENPHSHRSRILSVLQTLNIDFDNKVVVDFPAGDGVNSRFFHEQGAKVKAFDLFPDFFKPTNLDCHHADITKGLPLPNSSADIIVCQEGIEHFQDPLSVFKEFARVLKEGGLLLLTTPSYSHLAARLAYFCFESESVRHMPPNEIDSIWRTNNDKGYETYYGHIFLLGVQKLRLFGLLSGLKIRNNFWIKSSKTSIFLFPFAYPLIVLISALAYYRNKKRVSKLPLGSEENTFRDQFLENIEPKNLLNKYTVLLFEKRSGS